VTTLKRISLLLALGACLAAAGCGSDDEGTPIPADTAAALDRQLDGVQARLDNGSAGACRDILEGSRGPNRDAVRQLLDGLPGGVDPDVRDALEQSFENLWSLVERRCEEAAADEANKPEPAPEPETTTPETQTETTETTPPETDTGTTPEEETLPPDGDGENGGAIPPDENGNGNGGGIGPGAAKEKKETE
jgi:hypothetical protein